MFYMSATSMLIMIGVSVVGVNTIIKETKKVYRNIKEQMAREREKFKRKDED